MSMKSTLELDDKQYDQAITKAGKAPGMLASKFAGLGAAIGGLGIAAVFQGIIEKGDEIGDIAGRFGVSAEMLQKLGVAGDRTGTSMESVAKGLQKMQANGMGADEIYNLADQVRNATTENEEFSIASAAVGTKLAGELIPMLRLGGEEMRNLGNSAQVMGDDVIESLSEANDSIFDFKQKQTSALGQVAVWVLKSAKLWEYFTGSTAIRARALGNIFGELGGIIKSALTGDFDGAKRNLANFGDFVRSEMQTMVDANESTWDELFKKKEKGQETAKPQGDKPEDAAKAKVEAEREAERLAAAREKREENIAKLKEDLRKKEIEAEEAKLTLQQLIWRKEAEARAARVDADIIQDPERRLEALNKAADLEKEILDLKEKQAEAQKKTDQERHDKLAAIGEKEADLAEAQLNAVKAQADLVQASLDRASSTLAELAEGGQNGHTKAKRAMRWEERAKERKARGDKEGATEALSKADKLRGELGGLSAADQNPMKAMTEAVGKQTVEVTTIKEDLARLIAALGSSSSS